METWLRLVLVWTIHALREEAEPIDSSRCSFVIPLFLAHDTPCEDLMCAL